MSKKICLINIFAVFVAAIIATCSPATAKPQCDGIKDDPIRSLITPHTNGDYHVVVDWARTKGIAARCPTGRLDSDVEHGTKVFVWMRSAGNAAALERLITERRLPLRHVWTWRSGSTWRVVDTVEVTGAGITDEDIKGLKLEASNRGFYDWRTYSSKENLRRGRWKVTIIDRLGQRVECHDTQTDCEIRLRVQ